MSLLEFWRTQSLPLEGLPDNVNGQVLVVTGANTGLGLAASKRLVTMGASRVIMASRSLSRGQAALEELERETGRKGVAEVWQLDLGSHSSTKEFAARITKELDRVDAIIANAGVAMSVYQDSEGYEMSIAINVINTFLMIMLVLPHLRQVARKHAIKPRVSVVASERAFVAKFPEQTAPDIFAALNTPENVTGDRYPTSKLLQLIAVRALSKRLPVAKSGVIIDVLNPGLVSTELSRNAVFPFWIILAIMKFVFARSPQEACKTLVFGAECDETYHGKYMSENLVIEKMPTCIEGEKGKQLQDRFWTELASHLEKIEPGCVKSALA